MSSRAPSGALSSRMSCWFSASRLPPPTGLLLSPRVHSRMGSSQPSQFFLCSTSCPSVLRVLSFALSLPRRLDVSPSVSAGPEVVGGGMYMNARSARASLAWAISSAPLCSSFSSPFLFFFRRSSSCSFSSFKLRFFLFCVCHDFPRRNACALAIFLQTDVAMACATSHQRVSSRPSLLPPKRFFSSLPSWERVSSRFSGVGWEGPCRGREGESFFSREGRWDGGAGERWDAMGGRTTAERTVHSTRGSRTWRRSTHVRTFPPHTNQSHGNHPGASGVDQPRGSSQQRKDQSIRHEYSFIGRSRSIRAFSGGTRTARSDRSGKRRVLFSAEKRPIPSRKY